MLNSLICAEVENGYPLLIAHGAVRQRGLKLAAANLLGPQSFHPVCRLLPLDFDISSGDQWFAATLKASLRPPV
jgi:hypothetical protein